MTFDEWLQQGYQAGFCGPDVCITHDGMPTTADEDAAMEEGEDHCAHILRLYEDAEMKQAVEANHPPSKWRASNAGLTEEKLATDQLTDLGETFQAVATLLRDQLEEHIRSKEVSDDAYIDPNICRDDHIWLVDGRINFHLLAGLLARDLLKTFTLVKDESSSEQKLAAVDPADLEQLLAVARLYVTAFDDDETMTLPEKLRLQEIERILGIGVADGG